MSNRFLQQHTRIMELSKLVAETFKEEDEHLKKTAFEDFRNLTLKNQSNNNTYNQYADVLRKTHDICKENDKADPDSIYKSELDQVVEYGDTNFVDQFDNFVSNCTDGDITCDGSLVISEVQQTHLDPWTKMKIRVPVRSAICRHVYESDSIKERFKLASMQCPYVGCKAVLTKDDLVYTDA